MLNDAELRAYFDQPEVIQLTYLTPSGPKVRPWRIPDFFVIRKDTATWIELKPKERLTGLARESPTR